MCVCVRRCLFIIIIVVLIMSHFYNPQHSSTETFKSSMGKPFFTLSHASSREFQVWQMDLQRKLPLTTDHQARQQGAVARQPTQVCGKSWSQVSSVGPYALLFRPIRTQTFENNNGISFAIKAKLADTIWLSPKRLQIGNVKKAWNPKTKPVTQILQRKNFTVSKIIPSASNSRAITSEKHHMIITCRNLRVCHTLVQWWKAALNCTAITSEKHCMIITCRNLGVFHTLMQRWNSALSFNVPSASNGKAITLEQHGIKTACRNHSRSPSRSPRQGFCTVRFKPHHGFFDQGGWWCL